MAKASSKSVIISKQSTDKQVNSDEIKVKSNNKKFTMKHFQSLFGEQVVSNERLFADYSGAILRDMVIAGRLYITQGHLCFYGSFLKWETKIVIKLADVSSIVKAKTIKVIPNAIQIVTRTGDKYVFTSLVSRHKVYQTLIYAWTGNPSQKLINYDSDSDKSTVDPSIRKCYSNLESGSKRITYNHEKTSNQTNTKRKYVSTGDLADVKFSNIPATDLMQMKKPRETRSLRIDKPIRDPTKCPYAEPCLVDIILPVNLNRLFEMLFTDSSFGSAFTDSLKHTITVQREWTALGENDLQHLGDSTIAVRQFSREMILDYPFAKNMSSEEKTYLEHLDTSNYYGIKLLSESSGLPLCSLFNVVNNYCLYKTANPSETHFHFHYKILFKSKAWGLKSLIEDGTKRACLDYVESLVQMIKKWSIDNPDYVTKPDLPSQLKPFCSESINDETPDEFVSEKQPVAQSLSKPICAQQSNMKNNQPNQPEIECLSTSSSKNEKNSVSCSSCPLVDHNVQNFIRYLKPLFVFLLVLTLINFFLMIRLINNDVLSSSSLCQGQVSPSTLMGLSTCDEKFESLSNYAYPSL